ncbi:MAG: helix-hairpin-helix domain-containing protein [Gemmatimonadota bacterium]|jgi:competence protein ComEA
MTPLEARGALKGGLLILALSVLRLGVVTITGHDPIAIDGESELEELLEESLREKADADRRGTPLSVGETLDPNRSEEEDLDRLPGVGPATAEAIIQVRRNQGWFRRAEDLLEVPGIGPATLEKIRPFLDLTGGTPLGSQGYANRRGNLSPPSPAQSLPQTVSRDSGLSATRPPRVDLNRADVRELETLPGIGPALAQRIVEDRRSTGLFSKPEDLLRVRGIGPATLERIRNLILPRG